MKSKTHVLTVSSCLDLETSKLFFHFLVNLIFGLKNKVRMIEQDCFSPCCLSVSIETSVIICFIFFCFRSIVCVNTQEQQNNDKKNLPKQICDGILESLHGGFEKIALLAVADIISTRISISRSIRFS